MKRNVSQRVGRAMSHPLFREHATIEQYRSIPRVVESVGPWAFDELPQWLQDAVLAVEAATANA
jgi:hypothetical protein